MAVTMRTGGRDLAPRPRTATGLAVFDLDRTLIPGSSLAIFGRAVARRGLLRRRDVARFALTEATFNRRGLDDDTIARLCSRLLRHASGHAYDRLLDIATEAAPEIVDSVFPVARLLVEQHRRAGDVVALVSASPEPLVVIVAGALDIDLAIGTRIEVADGCLTGRLGSALCYGSGKVTRLRDEVADLDARVVTAYADSASDIALLTAADHPVAVNPDRRLSAAAAASSWPVLHFK